MASIRDLKKDINSVLGDIIEAVYIWEGESGNGNSDVGSVIIDEAIAVFDDLMGKVNQNEIDNKKAHFKVVRDELEEKATQLIEKLNDLA